MSTLFISDLHLDSKRPNVINFFINFLNNLNNDVKTIYILGDFVEYWVGDDDPAIGLQEVFKLIKKISKKIDIYFMHGNRDFMISKKYCEKNGMKLLSDPTIINLYNKKILLMHGDTLCIDDTEYQKFRYMVRSEKWQKEMLKKPLNERLLLAKNLRTKSKNETDNKDEFIMDVNDEEVKKVILKHNADILIHGHTHRPNIQKILFNNKEVKRIVLGDWYDKSYILELNKNKISISKSSLY
jgi:UDP-2,3-diacylglucosamine hydrolase|tara:strand:+ start:583 stop:1305 length:723 start_codon:yes stop_codon:yes gene_type:complete